MTLVSEDRPEAAVEDPVLQPKISPRWALTPAHLLIAAFWGAFYYLLNYFPLRETDLWCHAAYGRWIVEHGALPTQDPFAPLTAGMRVIDSAWLSQVLYALTDAWAGAEGLSFLFAATYFAAFLVLARTFYLQSRSLLVTHVAVALVIVVGWSRISTARPEIFGSLLFALLLWLLVRDRVADDAARRTETPRGIRWSLWIGIPLVMLIWANIHGSFICGLLVLGCWFGGVAVETLWRTRSVRATVADPAVRRWLWLGELALAATLVNPYGVDLLLYTTWFADNENLREVQEWQRLVILDVGGREFALSLVLLMVVFRHSRRRMPVADVLLVAVFGLTVTRGIRMIWWYAAVFSVAVAPHLADLWTRLTAAVPPPRWWAEAMKSGKLFGLPCGRAWTYTLIAPLLIWIAFAISPAGTYLVSGTPRPPERLYSDTTPWKLTEYLRQNPPQGQMFNPQWWGDWLTWAGPRDIQVFMTTNMHLAPRQVWTDYRILRETRSGWANVLDRYRVETVVLDKQRQTILLRYLRHSRDWRISYEDEQGMVLRRVYRDTVITKRTQET